jgi:hypothetical protein
MKKVLVLVVCIAISATALITASNLNTTDPSSPMGIDEPTTCVNYVYADVDGDGVSEVLQLYDATPTYTYPWRAPFFGGNGFPRVWAGLESLQESVYLYGEPILNTGYWGPFDIYQTPTLYDTVYNTKQTSTENNCPITVWASDDATLKRTTELSTERLLLRYQVWLSGNGDTSSDPIFEVAMIVVWNDGETTIDGSLNGVLQKMEYYKQNYNANIQNAEGSGLSFMLNYSFDDQMKNNDEYSVIAWDGAWDRENPDTAAIFGMVHLSKPTEILPIFDYPREYIEHAVVEWKFGGEIPEPAATVIIKPETLNLDSKGVFTAFITLENGDVTDIDASTLVCEGAPAIRSNIDDDRLIVKFDRQDLVGVEPGDEVTFTIKGYFFDGTPFEGSDTIRVIHG